MRRLRHRLVQRLVALLLVAGVGAGVAPPARAAASEAAGRFDTAALGVAQAAARQAPTREAAADAFVAAYVRVSGDVDARRALYEVLLGSVVREVPPASPPAAVVSAAAPSAPAPTPDTGAAGVLAAPPRFVADARAEVRPDAPAPASRPGVARRARPARAP